MTKTKPLIDTHVHDCRNALVVIEASLDFSQHFISSGKGDAETVLRLINNAKQQTEKINQLLNQLPNTIDHSE